MNPDLGALRFECRPANAFRTDANDIDAIIELLRKTQDF